MWVCFFLNLIKTDDFISSGIVGKLHEVNFFDFSLNLIFFESFNQALAVYVFVQEFDFPSNIRFKVEILEVIFEILKESAFLIRFLEKNIALIFLKFHLRFKVKVKNQEFALRC